MYNFKPILDDDIQTTIKNMYNAETQLGVRFVDTNIKTNGNVFS